MIVRARVNYAYEATKEEKDVEMKPILSKKAPLS